MVTPRCGAIGGLWLSIHLNPAQHFLPLEDSPCSSTRGGLSSSTPCFSEDTYHSCLCVLTLLVNYELLKFEDCDHMVWWKEDTLWRQTTLG